MKKAGKPSSRTTSQKTPGPNPLDDHVPSTLSADSMRILVIEDDVAFQKKIRKALADLPSSHYDVVSVRTLTEGSRMLTDELFDLVLMDPQLPDSDGLEAVRKVRAQTPAVPLVIMDRILHTQTALEALRLGAQDYLIKDPLEPAVLARVVRYAVERKQAELKLKLAEERYRTIFDNSAVGITVCDGQERIISWNKFAEDLFGMGHADLYLRPVSSLYSEEEWKRIRSFNVRQKGMQPHLETRMRKKSGEIIDIDISITVLKDPQGAITGSIGIIRDITERKQAELKLKLAEERYRTIFDNSAVAITVCDGQERIVSWNKFAEDLFGMSHEDLHLRPVRSLYSEEEWKRIRSFNVRQKGMQHHLETQMRKKSGEVIDIDISITVLKDLQGNITGSIGIIRDITDRKRAEYLQMIQAAKMESVGRLAAGVAHEVKNPLATILMAVEYLQARFSQDEEAAPVIGDIQQAVKRADSVIKGLLDFSAPGRLDLTEDDLNSVVERALLLTKHELDKNKILVQMEAGRDLPHVRLDAVKVEQVLINIITNAVHAMRADGKGILTIRTSVCKDLVKSSFEDLDSCKWFPGGQALLLEVENTGPCISEEHMSRVFEPFFTTKKSSGEGTGLGLTVCRKIIELHGGRMRIDNLPPRGLRVSIIFRFASEAPR